MTYDEAIERSIAIAERVDELESLLQSMAITARVYAEETRRLKLEAVGLRQRFGCSVHVEVA